MADPNAAADVVLVEEGDDFVAHLLKAVGCDVGGFGGVAVAQEVGADDAIALGQEVDDLGIVVLTRARKPVKEEEEVGFVRMGRAAVCIRVGCLIGG